MTTLVADRSPAVRDQQVLRGVRHLAVFSARRDRVRSAAWIAGAALIVLSTATNYSRTYATAADLATIADTLRLPATVALAGPYQGGDHLTYGELVSQALLGLAAALVGLMSILAVVRSTRADEESGCAELVRSAPVGRHAPLVAAITSVGLTDLALGAAVAVALAVSGVDSIDVAGAALFGAAVAATGLAFAGVAAVTAQLGEYGRSASGLAGVILGAAYALRAIGDVGGGTLSWLSPIGWAQAARPFSDDRWWPLLLSIALAALMVAAALVLSVHRDVGAGLRSARPGRGTASAALGTPIGLAVRLQRAGLAGWTLGMLAYGLAYGSILGDADDLVGQIAALRDLLIEGSTISRSLAATLMTFAAIITAIYAVLALLKLRAEEMSGRAEAVLATGVSRLRWAGSHVAVALGGSAIVLIAVGVGLGVSSAIALHDRSMFLRMIGAALCYVPAVWVTVGFAVVLVGIAPRRAWLAWFAVAYPFGSYYATTFLGAPRQFGWLSPIAHVPLAPAAPVSVLPLVLLGLVAAGLHGIGLVALRRRDVAAG